MNLISKYNRVLVEPKGNNFFVVSLTGETENSSLSSYNVEVRIVSPDGKFVNHGGLFAYTAMDDAVDKIKKYVRMKTSKFGFKEIPVNNFKFWKFFSANPDSTLSSQSMLSKIDEIKSKTEKGVSQLFRSCIVVFHNVDGLSSYFDIGLEYFAFTTENDLQFVNVYDRFGDIRGVSRSCLSISQGAQRKEFIDSLVGAGVRVDYDSPLDIVIDRCMSLFYSYGTAKDNDSKILQIAKSIEVEL